MALFCPQKLHFCQKQIEIDSTYLLQCITHISQPLRQLFQHICQTQQTDFQAMD